MVDVGLPNLGAARASGKRRFRPPHQRAHVVAGCDQPRHEVPAIDAVGAEDRNLHRFRLHSVRSAG